MESNNKSADGDAMPSPQAQVAHEEEENDPELEWYLRALAQWLFDVYLWRFEEERKSRPQEPVDKHPPPPTM